MGAVNETIIIEEISRNQKFISRQKYNQANISVGRSYDNDVIISDPHVCPEHLNITFDGEFWRVHDLDTINGSFLGEKKKSADHHIVHSGDVISIGKSQIRIVFPNHPVAESVVFSPFENLINLARKPVVLIAAMALFTCLAAHLFYLTKPIEVSYTQFFVPAIGMTLGFAMWPCGVALVSHLTKNDSRIWHQLGISFIFFNLFWLTDFIENILLFNSSSNFLVSLTVMALPILIAFGLFWLNAYIGFHMTNKRRNFTALGLVVLFFGGSSLVQMSNQPEFRPYPSYDNTIMPPNFLLTSGSSVDTFINEAETLFASASKAANEDD
mgnify:FL=1